MAVNTKAIKNRIRSVKNTKKITKAMEMMSAVKMKKAVDTALSKGVKKEEWPLEMIVQTKEEVSKRLERIIDSEGKPSFIIYHIE